VKMAAAALTRLWGEGGRERQLHSWDFKKWTRQC